MNIKVTIFAIPMHVPVLVVPFRHSVLQYIFYLSIHHLNPLHAPLTLHLWYLPRESPRAMKLVVVSTTLACCGGCFCCCWSSLARLAEETLGGRDGRRGVLGRFGEGRPPPRLVRLSVLSWDAERCEKKERNGARLYYIDVHSADHNKIICSLNYFDFKSI